MAHPSGFLYWGISAGGCMMNIDVDGHSSTCLQLFLERRLNSIVKNAPTTECRQSFGWLQKGLS